MAPSTPRRPGAGTQSKPLATPSSKLRGTPAAKQGLTPKSAAKTGRTPTPARRRAALVADDDDDDDDDDADSGSDVADYETADDGYEDAMEDSDDDRSDEGSDGDDDDGDAASAGSGSDAEADEFVDARGSDGDEDDGEDDEDHGDDEDSYDQGASGGSSGEESRSVGHESDHAGSSDDASAAALGEGRRRRKKKVKATLTPEQLAEYQAKIERTGVVYISRVPPYMKPQKLRQLLSKYAAIDRIYLAPEDPKVRARRIKYGGNRKINYTEGWVEFKDKREAKLVAAALNNTTIGGKKRNFYHDDIWTLKYLPKFKWHHLTESVAYERAARQQRLRTEVAQAKRENAFYLQNVEKARVLNIVEERKRKRDAAGSGDAAAGEAAPKAKKAAGDAEARAAAKAAEAARFEASKARFRQRQPILKEGMEVVPTVASKLFAK